MSSSRREKKSNQLHFLLAHKRELRELHFKRLTATQNQTTRLFTEGALVVDKSEGTAVLSANGKLILMKSGSVLPELHEKVRSWVASYIYTYVSGSGERGPGKQ